MAVRLGKVWWLAIGGAVLGALLAYAWADGGLRPVRPLAEPVALPGTVPLDAPEIGQ